MASDLHTTLKTRGTPTRQGNEDPLGVHFPRRGRGFLDGPYDPTVDQSRFTNERVG